MLTHKKRSAIDLQSFALGCTIHQGSTIFRLFCPDATRITVHLFEDVNQEHGFQIFLHKSPSAGIWEGISNTDHTGKWYAYNIEFPLSESPNYRTSPHLIADPYSVSVAAKDHHLGFYRSYISPDNHFDWEDDTSPLPDDPRDLVIYETHIKDLVADTSAQSNGAGAYKQFVNATVGGIAHLKRMGVNAVEFLPLQKFGYAEPPFYETTEEGIKNTWNPYSTNYWGYMTSFFKAPEPMFASDWPRENNEEYHYSTLVQRELKQLVKLLHKEGISVILDVVYNHASQYDLNPLEYTSKGTYFKKDHQGNFTNDSWTGNDLDSRSPQCKDLILDSIRYWMEEYHIDGFRFDLAGIIDEETLSDIKNLAKSINPNAVLIGEPWGGEYKPHRFSDLGWSAWNDKIRNGFKGFDPIFGKGYIFGNWNDSITRFALENFLRGTLKGHDFGLFNTSEHSVNYLESHDGYTLGDFIRIALDHPKKEQIFSRKRELIPLNEDETRIAKFAALVLFASQGITMIHAGQEWGRSKMIAHTSDDDANQGRLDHDSYNKDNETNWLDFSEIEPNSSLFEYYRGLIALRLSSSALRKALPSEVEFKYYNDPLHMTFSVDGTSTEDAYKYFVSLNANRVQSHRIELPEGVWEMVCDLDKASKTSFDQAEKEYFVPPSSGVILRQLR
ncbi:MAG: alpha-amylase family glycosyl hydrolase [Bacteroidota bacterium]